MYDKQQDAYILFPPLFFHVPIVRKEYTKDICFAKNIYAQIRQISVAFYYLGTLEIHMYMTNYFSNIIAPVSLEDFFITYHEKDILHLKRNDEQYYHSILTSAEISTFLDRQDIFYPSLRIVKEGKEIPAVQYTKKAVPIGHHKKDDIIDTNKAFALFNNGCTLVIQAGQRYFDHLSKCCLSLSQKFNAPVQANLYITPNTSVGFNPHWDTHDVFVLQISGTKTWKLYGFEKELPTKNQKFVSKGYSKQPIKTLQLFPGDFLYVPRGYVHDAMADDGISAHITIGILSYTWARLFQEVFPQLEEKKAFREAVPFWSGDITELVKQKVALLIESIAGLDFDKGIQRLNQHYKAMQPQPVNHYFQSLLDIKNIHVKTSLAVNEGVVMKVNEAVEGLNIELFDKTISLPHGVKPLIDFIMEKRQFVVADLPGNAHAETIKPIISLLVKEGVLYVANM